MQDDEPEQHEIVGACPILIERPSSRVELPTVELDRDAVLGVAEINPIALPANLDAMLHRGLGQSGTHQQVGDASFRVALTRVVTR